MRDINKHNALKRKRLWDHFGWVYRGLGYLSKNHSLKCGCAICRYETYRKKQDARRSRRKAKDDLRKMLIVLTVLFTGCVTQIAEPELCYECTITEVWQRCDTTEIVTITEPPKCGWTEDEIAQYERKNTYTLNEKCFILIRTCECKPIYIKQ